MLGDWAVTSDSCQWYRVKTAIRLNKTLSSESRRKITSIYTKLKLLTQPIIFNSEKIFWYAINFFQGHNLFLVIHPSNLDAIIIQTKKNQNPCETILYVLLLALYKSFSETLIAEIYFYEAYQFSM